ncbi:MAG: hypothetical protein ACOX5G_05070 [Kiritimatiellia bacterium]|jgi:hypothetical protein
MSLRTIRKLLLALSAVAAVAAPLSAQSFFEPVGMDDLEEGACRMVTEKGESVAESAFVVQLFHRGTQWRSPDTQGIARHVIAFAEPRAIGTVFASAASQIDVLKPGAAWPPDGSDDSAWEPLPILGRAGQQRMAVAKEPGLEARAIRVSRDARIWAGLSFLRISPKRLDNLALRGFGHAEGEYTLRPDMGPPHTYTMANMLKGRDRWQNTGPDKGRDNVVPRPPVSDINPAWFILSWPEPQTLLGLMIDGNGTQLRISEYRGPENVHPLAGVDSEWKRIRDFTQDGGFVFFPGSVTARALKVEALRVNPVGIPDKGNTDRIAQVFGLFAFADLADGALPEAVAAEAEEPPVAFSVPVAEDGTVSVVIDTPDGRRIRNLVARQPVESGTAEIAWDLNDEDGMLQGVGTYRWTALTVPKLDIAYQMTPYPNIEANSSNSPWLNGAGGPGGWQADHSAPRCVTATGDWVFFGSPCAESGVAMIGCDLDGVKKWGHHNFMAWTGPGFLASDGRRVFAGAATGTDRVWTTPVAGGGGTAFIQAGATADRLRGMAGLAADGKNLFMSVSAPGVSVFARACTPADIDFDHTIPFLKRDPKPDRGHWDKRLDLARIFRLTGTPPGQNDGLTYIESTDMPASRQHMVLAFHRDVPLGALAFPLPGGDLFLRIAYLKADSPWPLEGNAYKDDAHWQEIYRGRDAGWTVMPLPADVRTRALRITWDRDEDDLGDFFDLDGEGGGETPWVGRIDGMCLLKNRLSACGRPSEILVSSGTVGDLGDWDALRDEPITEDNPAVYAMVWDEPQDVRGLAVMEIDGKRTEIDVYEGPDTGAIDPADDSLWRNVGTYHQRLRYYYQPDQERNSDARYMDGYVDFGSTLRTRAIRLRVCEQWLTRGEGREGCYGVRADRGAQDIDAARCRIYGVAAVKLLGSEDESDLVRTDRIEVYELEKGERVAEWPLKRPGDLALSPDGATLYAISATNVVAIDRESGTPRLLSLDGLLRPFSITTDAEGELYVYDISPDRLNVRVYNPASGELLRTIGTPGGRKVGPWDPTAFTTGPYVAVDLAVDKNRKLWVTECEFATKRASRWDAATCTFEKEYLGNTRYGGGGDGCIDPWDKTKAYYADGGATVQYTLDWESGRTGIAGIVGFGQNAGGNQPVRVGGHDYLVTRPLFWRQSHGRVYLLENGVSRLVAAVGAADAFELLRNREILGKLGRTPLAAFHFTWSDLNADGAAQADEVHLVELPGRTGELVAFDRELGISCDRWRFAVKEFLADGTPVYEVVPHAGALAGRNGLFRLPDGKTIQMSMEGHAGFGPDGAPRWSWKTEGLGVHAYYSAGPYVPRQVVAEFDIVGAETIGEGGLGSFYATSSNTGTWHLWSGDGILFGRLFQDQREHGRAGWAMPEHDRGMSLHDVTLGQEHFSGYLCREQGTDNILLCAGHNHISVCEVKGLDRVRRHTGEIEIDAETLQKAADWLAARSRDSLYSRAPVLRAYRAPRVVIPDGDLSDWGEEVSSFGDGDSPRASLRMSYDARNLYVAWHVRGYGPFKNAGNDWRRLFKTGACVDIQIGLDPGADPGREETVEGDVRILVAPMDGKPVVVLYRQVDPTASEADGWESHTMVFRTRFDRVEILEAAEAGFADLSSKEGGGYAVELVVPLEAIGAAIQPDTRLRFDWGVQEVGADGSVVMQRLYWANQSTRIVSDEAAEARLYPGLWGDALFLGEKPAEGGIAAPDELDLGGGLSGGAEELFRDILEDDDF